MEKVRYMISDAASMVAVESHVLRYWEEELALDIPRNELGHRYYTEENIAEFQRIKELKEQGYQLRAIRVILHDGSLQEPKSRALAPRAASSDLTGFLDHSDRMAQFTELMTEIVGKALAANNEALSRTITEDVGEQVLKEMNYLMREQDEAAEERFRKLDEAIRGTMQGKDAKKSHWWAKK